MMKKSAIRALGIGLFLAGAVFQIQESSFEKEITSTSTTDREKYEKSQEELKILKQQLANLQLDIKNAQEQKSPKETEDTTETTSTETKSFLVILPGMTVEKISSTLFRAQIIETEKELQDYIVANNLSGLIQIGEYDLDSSMSIEEIAKIITNTQE